MKCESPLAGGLGVEIDAALTRVTEQAILPGGKCGGDADEYFEVFRRACETGNSRCTEVALDGLHALIEFGFLRGTQPAPVVAAATAVVPTAGGGDGIEQPVGTRTMMDVVIETVCKCSDDFDDGVQLQIIKVLLTAVTSSVCKVNESSLLLAVRACFHIHLVSKNPINKVTTKAALTQMMSSVVTKMEVFDSKLKSSTEKLDATAYLVEAPHEDVAIQGLSSVIAGGSTHFSSILHKNAFLLFRALCKLSMKGLHDDASGTQADAVAMQNKVLSLELILQMLRKSGPTFRNGERFIFVIRHYLCVSLLGNCTSQVGQVTDLSIQVFVALMEGFKDHLKSELEVFFTNVFLRILESENSTYEHKLRVLEVLHGICRDSKALVEIFINYDCDLDATDLYKRIVDGFARTTKNPNLSFYATRLAIDFISSAGQKAEAEDDKLRKAGLEGVVTILRSLLRTRGILDDNAELISGPVISEPPTTSTHDEDSVAVIDSCDIGTDEGVQSAQKYVTSVVTSFDKKQRVKEEIATGILKFNLSSKKGLAYLCNAQHIEMTGKSVAAFFHQYSDRLDKAAMGDFLGREKEYEHGFCIEVLHEYVEIMDFANMEFDLAIRHFLSGFRLPGEAQKIDRIMEKFAERYYLQNQDKFASADMAFILAFSTIMLQTNLHNPAIREDKRMTKEEFIKQNTKISEDGELSVDMLCAIYDRIAAQPISMTQDEKLAKKSKKEEQSTFAVFQLSNDRKRYDAFNDERKEMVRVGEALFKKKNRNTKVLLRRSPLAARDDAYLSPMFEVTWAPVLAVLSQVLETTDDPSLVSLCLTGFEYAIRLSCRVDNSICRSTYINGLLKFTALGSFKEMKYKHVESIKVLANIALTEGDYLDEDWVQVLQGISQLARLQLLAAGGHSDDIFFGNSKIPKGNGDALDSLTKLFVGPSKADTVNIVAHINAELVAMHVNSTIVDQIFLNSNQLSDDAVHAFVRALCAASFQEITSNTNNLRGNFLGDDSATPRVFCLQKLVEVADFNMPCRSRIAWANMWELLAQHFTAIGIHDNLNLAMFAIDSLKQLSIKFLQKEELSNFNFQRVFLRPFEFIMAKSRLPQIKDLILRCVDNMIQACSGNIRSGWRTIFLIFEASASQDNSYVSSLSFQILENLIGSETGSLVFDLVDLMNCLVKFIAGPDTVSSLKALGYLSQCASHLVVTTETASPHTKASAGAVSLSENDESVFRLWWPLLLGLSTRVSDARKPVRLQALDSLQRVLDDYGSTFSSQAWGVIFRGVLFPIMDSAKADSSAQLSSRWPTENPVYTPRSCESNDWIGTTAKKALSVTLLMFSRFSKEHQGEVESVLPDLLAMIEGCICQETESLAVIGVEAFSELFAVVGKDCVGHSPLSTLICGSIAHCVCHNLCTDFGTVGTLNLSTKIETDVVLTSSGPTFQPRHRVSSGEEDSSVVDGSAPKLTEEQAWARRETSIMTTMVITLKLLDLISSLSETGKLERTHHEVLLEKLQSIYWHARSFNEDQELRSGLAAKGFMKMPESRSLLPHLLEQEALSATKIVKLSMELFHQEDYDSQYIEPWVRR